MGIRREQERRRREVSVTRKFTALRAKAGVSAALVVAAAGVVAAGSTAAAFASSGHGGASAASTLTLKIGWVTEDKAPMQALITAFEKAHPNVNVEATYTPLQSYGTVLRPQLLAGTAPPIFETSPGTGTG